MHHIPLGNDLVKVGVEEVQDVDARSPIPTKEVKLVGQILNTFLAWSTHLTFFRKGISFLLCLLLLKKDLLLIKC